MRMNGTVFFLRITGLLESNVECIIRSMFSKLYGVCFQNYDVFTFEGKRKVMLTILLISL